jgi:hypothetical protein
VSDDDGARVIAAAHARNLIRYVAEMAGLDPGEIVVILRGSVGEDRSVMYTWDWFWRPLAGEREADIGITGL